MLVKLKSFYRTFFPARQLLIRQNGEVKHLVLAPWLQLTTLMVILIAIAWLSISTLQIISQADKITSIEQKQVTKQQEWKKQHFQQQAAYEKQLEQLAILEQKQALLQSMIESLPESMNKPTLPNDAEPLLLPIKENAEDFHAPLEDEQQPKQVKHLESMTERLARLDAAYNRSFVVLDEQIKLRHQEIVAMLEGAGLDSSLANTSILESSDTAQGGPLDLFDESRIPAEFSW